MAARCCCAAPEAPPAEAGTSQSVPQAALVWIPAPVALPQTLPAPAPSAPLHAVAPPGCPLFLRSQTLLL